MAHPPQSRSSPFAMTDMAHAWTALHAAVAACGRREAVVPLTELCIGMVLAQPVICAVAVPPTPCSRLDGYALLGGQQPGEFHVATFQRLGHTIADERELRKGEVAWVTTGAPLPRGTNAVVGVEFTGGTTPAATPGAETRVRIDVELKAGDNVRAAGSDAAVGEELLRSGVRLGLQDVVFLQSIGVEMVCLFCRPRVGVLSTGDELTSICRGDSQCDGAAGRSDRIFDSNRPMLLHLVREAGGDPVDLGIVQDSAEHIRTAIVAAISSSATHTHDSLSNNNNIGSSSTGVVRTLHLLSDSDTGSSAGVDILITSGGVSMGDRDHVKPVLLQLVNEANADALSATVTAAPTDGSEVSHCSSTAAAAAADSRVLFGRLNMKPGKPAMGVLLRVPPSPHTRNSSAATTSAPSSSPLSAPSAPSAALSTAEISAAPAPPSAAGSAGPRTPRNALIIACPGNPVSAWVCFHILAYPAIRYALGTPWCAQQRPQFQQQSQLQKPPLDGAAAAAAAGNCVIATHGAASHGAAANTHAAGTHTASATDGATATRESHDAHHHASLRSIAPHALTNVVVATLLDTVPLDFERPEFHRVCVWQGDDGRLVCRSTGAQASSRLASTTRANGLAWLPQRRSDGASALLAPAHVELILVGALVPVWDVPPSLVNEREIRVLGGVVVSTGVGGAIAHGSGGGGCGCSHGAIFHSPPRALSDSAATAAVTAAAPAATAAAATIADAHSAVVSASSTATAAASAGDIAACVLTVSDRCAAGQATDASGPEIVAWLRESLVLRGGARVYVEESRVVPDDAIAIRGAVESWVLGRRRASAAAAPASVGTAFTASNDHGTNNSTNTSSSDHGSQQPYGNTSTAAAAAVAEAPIRLIITTGGTGMGPRDVTPEALRPLITRPAHGLVHAMLAAGMRHTPLAALSRYEAGVIVGGAKSDGMGAGGAGSASSERANDVLLIELPGSVKAVRECLEVIRTVLPHALELIGGNTGH